MKKQNKATTKNSNKNIFGDFFLPGNPFMPHPLASLRRHPVRVGICLSMSIRLCSLTRPRGVNYTEKKKVKSKEMKSKEEELGRKS